MSLENICKEKFNESLINTKEIGFVEKTIPPLVYVKGIPRVKLHEVLYFESGQMGVVTSLLEESVEVLSLSKEPISIDTRVSRSGDILKVRVGESLLGHALDPLCMPLSDNNLITGSFEYREIDASPLGISYREKVVQPFETGVSMVDFLIPLGKGQRELVIGDRNIGKTTFVQQSILSQAKKGTVCIYAGIGKKKHSIKKVVEFVEKHHIKDRCILVGSYSSDSTGFIHITPYTAMTIAEYFRDMGKDVFLILDDMTTHAKYYRELSLISKKFPGRDAYPGDIFYAHARLLERGGNYKTKNGNTASITCMPIAETVEGDVSGYVQTNLMSITDGHIFFDQDLYKRGKRPAINHFLSVTRVGRQTQSGVRWGINRELTSFLILHEKTERFIHFGAEVNEGIKATLSMGERIGFFFEQSSEDILDLNIQILIFGLIWTGILKEESAGKIKYYVTQAQKWYEKENDFKEKVDKLIGSCENFNQFLGKTSSTYKEVIEYLEKHHEEG